MLIGYVPALVFMHETSLLRFFAVFVPTAGNGVAMPMWVGGRWSSCAPSPRHAFLNSSYASTADFRAVD